jgi:hypothetical protein
MHVYASPTNLIINACLVQSQSQSQSHPNAPSLPLPLPSVYPTHLLTLLNIRAHGPTSPHSLPLGT